MYDNMTLFITFYYFTEMGNFGTLLVMNREALDARDRAYDILSLW